MPDRDKHQPGCSAAITHRNSQITIKNSSEDKESIPGQNRVNEYPASSRDNPLTSRRDDSSDNDHKPEPSHRIRLEERNVKLSPESETFGNFTVDETEYMSQGDDSDNNNSRNETPHRQTTVHRGYLRKEKYPITDTEDSTNRGCPAYRNAPTSNNSTDHKHSITSEHGSGAKKYANNNSKVGHSRTDPQSQYTKTKGDQTVYATTNVHYHEGHEDQEGSQPEGAQAMDKTASQRSTENARLSKFIFTLEEENYSSTEDITLRLAQTKFRTDKEQNQLGERAYNATPKRNPRQTMDVEDQHYFHQTGRDVSRTNQSGHLHTHKYVQKDSEVYYRPQKRLKGSRTSTLEETPGRSATQVDMGNKDINTSAVRPKVQPRDHETQGEWWETNDKHHKEEADEKWEDLDDNQNIDRSRRHDPGGSDQQHPQDPQSKKLSIIRDPHRNPQTETNIQCGPSMTS
jgi:hypothetical protein